NCSRSWSVHRPRVRCTTARHGSAFSPPTAGWRTRMVPVLTSATSRSAGFTTRSSARGRSSSIAMSMWWWARRLPPAFRLGANLVRNQGLGGTVGFVSGFRRAGKRDKRCVEVLLDAAVAGDELAVQRAVHHGASVSLGDTPITIGELVDEL